KLTDPQVKTIRRRFNKGEQPSLTFDKAGVESGFGVLTDPPKGCSLCRRCCSRCSRSRFASAGCGMSVDNPPAFDGNCGPNVAGLVEYRRTPGMRGAR